MTYLLLAMHAANIVLMARFHLTKGDLNANR